MEVEIAEAAVEESLEQVVRKLDLLVRTFEQHPSEQVRQQALEMLRLVDALHREGVRRLVELLWMGNPTILGQALEDPAVDVLLQLYDLAPDEPDPLEQANLALETVRPYINSHGGSVEVLDVVDGLVHVRLAGACHGCSGSAVTLKRGIEAALREGFPGFQGIEVHEPVPPPDRKPPASFIPLQQVGAVRPLNRPVFTRVGSLDDLPAGTMRGIEVEGQRLLICNVEGEIYAYRNVCPGSILPLDLGQLAGTTLHCPWHNCVFDARTGKRLDAAQGRLDAIPVAVRGGEIQLALNVEPVPF